MAMSQLIISKSENRVALAKELMDNSRSLYQEKIIYQAVESEQEKT